ncbi:MAG: ABC transporter ATP-binding protein, partial [Xanthomonadaceae bacterium]|nr:ABC transporter ATP-binding protein [Xanthomonadaceae bacterium]
VTDLCPNMAIMNKGKVLLAGRPADAIAELEGKVWRKQVAKDALPEYEKHFRLLSTRLVAGAPVIHVFSADSPEDGFEQVAPDLEDVYFQRLRQHAKAA